MNSNQTNKLRMYLATQVVLETNRDIWEPLAAFAVAAGELDEQIGSIQTLLQKQMDKKGGTADKAYTLNALADAAFEVAAAVRAFAVTTSDRDLAVKMDYSRTDIVAGRDSQVLSRCQSIHAIVTDSVTSLADYGITPAKLTAFKKKMDAFASVQVKPRQELAASSAATKALPELFALADSVLNDRLDALVVQFKDSQSAFYHEYTGARVIVDQPGGRASKASKVARSSEAILPKAA